MINMAVGLGILAVILCGLALRDHTRDLWTAVAVIGLISAGGFIGAGLGA